MWSKLLRTRDSYALTIVRLVLGVVMFAHGAQKVLGWFGGSGLSATMNAFTQFMGIPAPLAYLAVAAEFLGGLGLIFGLLSRVAAFGVFCNMIVAIVTVHARFGLFMNWTGQQKGEGYEYHLVVIAVCLAVIIEGAGALSLDRALSRAR